MKRIWVRTISTMQIEQVGAAVDHGGVVLKEIIKMRIKSAGLAVADLGTDDEEPVDYPDSAEKLVAAMSHFLLARGYLSAARA